MIKYNCNYECFVEEGDNQMSKEKIIELVREKEQVEKDLKKMKKLQNEAFKVFGSKRVLPLEQIEKSYEKGGAWNDILNWYYDASEYSCYFMLRNPEQIGESFVKLNSAIINRKEFEENLSEAKEDILSYVKALEEALRALEQKIDILYCEFVQNGTGAYKWIFEQPFIKSIVLKFLEY